MELVTVQVCPSVHFWPVLGVSADVFQIILSWWRITTKRLTNLTLLPGPRAWSLRSVPYTFKAPTQGNSQRGTVAWILVPLDLLSNLLPPPTTVPSLPVSHYPMIELSRLSVEVIPEQRWLSIPLTSSPLPNLFPSSLRIQEVQHWVKRSGRSQESLTRDEGERAINIRCAERRHGCPKAS